jgi:alpha-tubulin suppressor-like RCC1 family protein
VRPRLLIAAMVLLLAVGGSSSAESNSPAIAAGGEHTCAIVSGSAKCWGDNEDGALGDTTIKDHHSPVAVSGLPGGVQAIVTGAYHTCALAGGGVWCWGDNEYGQLGDGTHTASSSPTAVPGLGSGVQALSASFHTCALLTGGALVCWGDNKFGELGDGTTAEGLAPTPVSGLSSGVEAVTAGIQHSCALVNGGVECWGDNEVGQVGDGTTTERHKPVRVSGLSSGVKAITAGLAHSCALLDSGAVKCWGYNHEGELGDGTETTRAKPVTVTGLPPGGARAIAAGSEQTCAILSSTGGVQCWGGFSDEPEDVQGLHSGVQAITAGGTDVDEFICALLQNGKIKCWGDNTHGQLGDGTTATRDNPVSVLGLASGANVLSVLVHGRGTVTGTGIRCTSECGYERVQHSSITLKASHAKRWIFKKWSGACSGTKTTCTLSLGANVTAVATFAKKRKRS